MKTPPEVFPKQAQLSEERRFGNWLRVPGRHHTRDHWAQVWDGERWLAGAEAVAFLLALDGDDPTLLPELPRPAPDESTPRSAPAPTPWQGRARSVFDGTDRASRAAAYMARLPSLGEGQGRDDVGYQFAAFLVRDLALADDVAREWLRRWDAGNNPPKGDVEISKWIASAHAYGRRAYGSGLGCGRPVRQRCHGHTSVRFTIEVP
jgi:hypothetical protein